MNDRTHAPLFAALALGLATPAPLTARGSLDHELAGGVPLPGYLGFSLELGADQRARSLAVGGGQAFAACRVTEPSGAFHYAVHAFDPETGDLAWEATLTGPIFSQFQAGLERLPLAVGASGSRVYAQRKVGAGKGQVQVAALDGATGAMRWDVVTTSGLAGGLALSESAGVLFEATFSGSKLRAAARNAADGSLLWEDTWDESAITSLGGYTMTTAISTDGQVAAVGWASGQPAVAHVPLFGVRVYDVSSGALTWEAMTGSGPLALAEDGSVLAVVDDQGDIGLFAAATGAQLWSVPPQGMVRALSFDAASSRLYVAIDVDPYSGADAPRLIALDTSSGATLWDVNVDPWGVGAMPLELRVSPDGTRLGAYLQGPPLPAFVEAVAVLLDAATGVAVGSTGVGNGMGPVTAGMQHDNQRLAFVESPGRLLVLGKSPKTIVGNGDRDVWIERLALSDGAWLPRHEFDVLLPAILDVRKGFLRDGGQELILAGVARAGQAHELAVSLDTATGLVNWQRKDVIFPKDPTGMVPINPGDAVLDPLGAVLFFTEEGVIKTSLRAVDADTGTLLWEHVFSGLGGVSNLFMLAVAPTQKMLYAVSRNALGYQDRAVAFDAQSGTVLWDVQNLGGFDSSAPTFIGVDGLGRLFVSGRAAESFISSWVSRVSALDAATGALLWTVAHGGAQTGGVLQHSSAGLGLSGGRVYVADTAVLESGSYTSRLELRTLDASTGTLLATGVRDFVGESIYSPGLEVLPELGLVAVAFRLSMKSNVAVVTFSAATGAPLATGVLGAKNVSGLMSFEASADGGTLFLAGRQVSWFGSSLGTFVSAVDPVSLRELWSAQIEAGIYTTDLAVSPGGESVAIIGMEGTDVQTVLLGTPPLIGVPAGLSLADGGVQTLKLLAGTAHAGEWHFVVGSASGTAPGTPLGAFTLPLNADGYLVLSATSPGAPVAGALGVLSPSGMAQVLFQLPAGVTPALAGVELNHAFATIRFTAGVPAVTSVSNAVPVTLVP